MTKKNSLMKLQPTGSKGVLGHRFPGLRAKNPHPHPAQFSLLSCIWPAEHFLPGGVCAPKFSNIKIKLLLTSLTPSSLDKAFDRKTHFAELFRRDFPCSICRIISVLLLLQVCHISATAVCFCLHHYCLNYISHTWQQQSPNSYNFHCLWSQIQTYPSILVGPF